MMDDAERYILRQAIASVLDMPSVYMGGPSHKSIRKAIAIVNLLALEYHVKPRDDEDANFVRTWRKSPWDSMERI